MYGSHRQYFQCSVQQCRCQFLVGLIYREQHRHQSRYRCQPAARGVKAEAIAVNPAPITSFRERPQKNLVPQGKRIATFGETDDARYRRRVRQK